jgi:glycosyltransferase involved in cell wall biosynthesis
MVPTQSMLNTLVEKGFPLEDVRQWSHGVDLTKFPVNLNPKAEWYEAKAVEAGLLPAGAHLKEPILLFVGRVGDEKNIEFFLDLPVEGTKVVVGDGPLLPSMKANPKYKDVLFFGRQPHSSIPEFMANASVFPFASLSETFGLVNLEAAATGTPVVTFDYLKEIIASPSVGRTVPFTGNRETDLQNFATATQEALRLDRQGVRSYAENWSWNKSIVEMLAYLHYLTPSESARLQK